VGRSGSVGPPEATLLRDDRRRAPGGCRSHRRPRGEPSQVATRSCTAWEHNVNDRVNRRLGEMASHLAGSAATLAGCFSGKHSTSGPGRQRESLRDQWKSDLIGPDGKPVTGRLQLQHSAGYVIAAARFRLVNDLGGLLGRRLDSVLISRPRTYMAGGALFAVPVLCASVRSLRKWRDVRPAEAKRGHVAGGGDA
jgi:hypothetical protein